MAAERHLRLKLSRRMVNFVTAVMPSLEGLFLATVEDGKAGLVVLRHHQSMAADVEAFAMSLSELWPGECDIMETEP